MLKQTTQLSVRTDQEQGFIIIEQMNDDINGQTDRITVAPEQIPLLIDWLQEAKAEVEALEKKHSRTT